MVKYYNALLIIQAAGTVISKRRDMERMCGYPPEYGGDELILKAIDDFLSKEDTKHELKEAHEFVKKFKEGT